MRGGASATTTEKRRAPRTAKNTPLLERNPALKMDCWVRVLNVSIVDAQLRTMNAIVTPTGKLPPSRSAVIVQVPFHSTGIAGTI